MSITDELKKLIAQGYDPANVWANLPDGEEREKRIRALIELNRMVTTSLQDITSNVAHMLLAFNGLMDSWWDELPPEIEALILPPEIKENIMQEIKEAQNDDDPL